MYVDTKKTNREAMERRAWDALRLVLPDTPEEIERWGSVIHWPDARVSYVAGDERGHFRWVVPITCGSCGSKRDALIYGRQTVRGKFSTDNLRAPYYEYASLGFTGLCRPCHKRINKQDITYHDGTQLFHQERTKDGLPVFCGACKKRGFLICALSETLHDKHWPCPSCGDTLGKWLHEKSGATVYWLKREEGQRNNVAFDCAKCGQSFYCKDDLPPRDEWWGMDDECRYKYNPLRVASPLGERVGQSPPKPGRHRPRLGTKVLIPCPFPDCGKINEFHIESTRRDGFLPLCQGKGKHTRNRIAAWVLSSVAQTTVAVPDSDPAFQQFLEVVRAINSRWSVVRDYPGRTFDKRLKMVGLTDVGALLGINQHTQETDKNYRNRVSSQLKTRGVSDGFPAFRKAVIEEVEAGRTVEEAARMMWAQRSIAKKAA
jgi:hypothetical protein